MNLRLMRCAAILAGALAAAGTAVSQEPVARSTASDTCQAPEYDGALMLDRQARITQYEGLGEQCLKRLLVECNAAASRQLLDAGSAFACSIGYEALLKRGFGGDFQAMLAWWRNRAPGSALN